VVTENQHDPEPAIDMLMKKRYIVCIGELTENQVEIGKYLPAKEDQCANDIEGQSERPRADSKPLFAARTLMA
jgi:hypothetical protein